MNEKINEYIDAHKEEMIAVLKQLINEVSSDGRQTKAQEVVQSRLEDLGFETQTFRMDERVKDCPDYCEPDIVYDEGAYNLAGTRKGSGDKKLMLFGHIDTEREDYFGCFDDPYAAVEKDNRIYGLGAADDKGGIAMMLAALKTALAIQPDLDHDLIVLSLLGKHGGAFGTLSAMMKGYSGDHSLYIHPAETGNGFQEIKNISLGMLDLKLSVYGRPGTAHDDLSPGVNANLLLAEAISILEAYNRKKREERIFDFGSFKGQPSFILNIGKVSSNGDYGSICEKAECLMRCRFFRPLTIKRVYDEIDTLLKEKLNCKWELEKGHFNGEPAMVPNDDPFVSFIEKTIEDVTGETKFIHQYHGGSDIRFPILYGHSKCVGIGPYCELPEKGSGIREWLDIDDYLKGIRILTKIILNYGKQDL